MIDLFLKSVYPDDIFVYLMTVENVKSSSPWLISRKTFLCVHLHIFSYLREQPEFSQKFCQKYPGIVDRT